MSAHGFIQELFARPQTNIASNVRFMTERQFAKLRELIGQDEEGAAVKPGMNGGLAWMPSGRWKYVLSVDMRGSRTIRTLTRLASIEPSSAGTLFP